MAINREVFKEVYLKTDRSKHKISVFLKQNKNQAFKVSELAKKIKMKEVSVRGMIRNLAKDGLIISKKGYVIWNK